MTTNFTPGPYSDNGDGFIRQTEQNEGHRLYIAQVIEIPFDFGGDKVTEANLNLIAAAPEMYAALVAMVNDSAFAELCAGIGEEPEWLRAARSALAKAKGGAA